MACACEVDSRPAVPFQLPMPSINAPLALSAGWYCVRAILWAFQFNAPLSVAAHAGAEFSSAGVPISIGATLLFSDGRRGHFQCGGCWPALCCGLGSLCWAWHAAQRRSWRAESVHPSAACACPCPCFAGFDRALVQTLEVAGTEGTISLCDFVIPTAEKKCR